MSLLEGNTSTRAGTIGGTLLSICPALTAGEIVQAAILAAVGAAVSFLVSLALKTLVQRIKKRYFDSFF